MRESSVSLKDQISMKGLETTMGDTKPRSSVARYRMLTEFLTGYISWIGKYAEHNAVLVDILIEAGAVPFVRTNVPQTLMVSRFDTAGTHGLKTLTTA